MPTIVMSPTRAGIKLSSLSMLDIVNYYNRRTGPTVQPKVDFNTNEVNCVPHFDPGLFSLRILSTCDGLQLKDQLQDRWIDGPVNTAPGQRYIEVVCLGEAASILTRNRFKSGIHRVTYPSTPHQSRLTIWQEVCTHDQIEQLLTLGNNKAIQLTKSDRPTLDISPRRDIGKLPKNINPRPSASDNADEFLPGDAMMTMINQPSSIPMRVPSDGQHRHIFMKRVENERGLSVSKSSIKHFSVQSSPIVKKASKSTKNGSNFVGNCFK
jgi:2OG-Fe(II) oxygenase superfamily